MRRSDYAIFIKRLLAFYTEDEAHEWMRSPHPQLEGRRAVDCMFWEVDRVIERLDADVYC
jgi:uncharacterized protein (DUF2384 family)